MAEPIEMPFGGLSHVDPTNLASDGVKIGRIQTHPRELTSRRCGLLSNYFGHLFTAGVQRAEPPAGDRGQSPLKVKAFLHLRV